MAKRKNTPRHPRAKALGKRAANYQRKLKVLRSLMGGFDAKKFDTLQRSKPKTTRGQVARRAALQKVSRTFERVRPYVHRDYKLVRPKNRAHFDTLRRFVGVTKFKHLRAIPLPTQAKRVTVRFDKQGRPLIREDGVGQTVFMFPHPPRSRTLKGKLGTTRFIDAQDDAVEMFKAMRPSMPDGFYIFLTRHHFLIPFIQDRDSIESQIRAFYSSYEHSPEFLATFFGFKWLTDSDEKIFEMRRELESERNRRRGVRKRQRSARALKEIIAMDKQLKSGQPLTRGQTTRRAKLSRRARATGRR